MGFMAYCFGYQMFALLDVKYFKRKLYFIDSFENYYLRSFKKISKNLQ